MSPKKIFHELGEKRERKVKCRVSLHFKEAFSHYYFSRDLNWSFNNAWNILRRKKPSSFWSQRSHLFHSATDILIAKQSQYCNKFWRCRGHFPFGLGHDLSDFSLVKFHYYLGDTSYNNNLALFPILLYLSFLTRCHSHCDSVTIVGLPWPLQLLNPKGLISYQSAPTLISYFQQL